MSNLHAHIATGTSDCDGPMYRDYTVFLNDEEKAEHERQDGVNDFHDLHFKSRILGDMVSFSPFVAVKVEVTTHGFTASEETEEGFRHCEVTWCEHECGESYSQRDIYAEMMGY